VNLAVGEIRLRPENSKNKTARIIPLTGRLLEIITRASADRRLDCRFVFHRNGESAISVRHGGQPARRQASTPLSFTTCGAPA
jgi:hypothetical protein